MLFTAGDPPPNPGEFVNSREVRALIESLREEFDYVLLDTPPLLSVSDVLTLSNRVDGIILVMKIGSIDRVVLRELESRAAQCGVPGPWFCGHRLGRLA